VIWAPSPPGASAARWHFDAIQLTGFALAIA